MREDIKVGVLFSGGKDSCLALHKYGKEKVDVLLAMIPENKDSFMFHCPILKLLEKQAKMLGIKLLIKKTKGEKEKELSDLKELIQKSGVGVVVIGGIKSNYQGKRIKRICKDLEVEVIMPIWEYNGEKLWKELIKNKFKVIMVKIASEGLTRNWIGKVIGKAEINELKKLRRKYKFDLVGEGGDFETAVLNMVGFKKEIKLKYDVKSEGQYRHFIVLKNE